MSGIGEKIKEVLTGHSNKDTSDETSATEGQSTLPKIGHKHRDDEIGAGHTQGRHDPEVDAKEATSQAGNYPYWGDLPREGETGDTQQSGTTAVGGGLGGDSHSFQKDSGLAAGALASGAAVTGAGTAATGARPSEYEHRPLGTQSTTTTTQDLTDRTRDTGLTSSTLDPAASQSTRDDRKGEIAAATAAGVAGVTGATYLGTRRKEEDTDKTATSGLSSGPALAGPGSLDPGYPSQPSSTPATGFGTPQQTSAVGSSADNSPYATTRGDTSHRKEEGALAAGAGVAGLGGAGYLAHKRAEERSREDERPSTVHSTQQRDTTSGVLSSQPQSTTGGGIHNTVVGAGSAEDANSRSYNNTASNTSPLSSSNTTTVGPQYGTAAPREQQTISSTLGAPSSGNDREKQGLAAAAGVGAGAGVVAAEEKHRHRDDTKSKDQSSSGFGSSSKHSQPSQTTTTSQPSAQLAAQQAWNNQNQSSSAATRHDPESDARQATSAAGNYPSQSNDRSTSNTAAVGTAAGAGLVGAGATAAYYGQGKQHDQNPRSDKSEKIAERALGSDGAAHAPSAGQDQSGGVTGTSTTSRSGLSSAGTGAAGLSGLSGSGSSKVVHKCHKCGADNDISDYFKKDFAY